MTLLMTLLLMTGFAAVYATVLAMLGAQAPVLVAALRRQPLPVQAAGGAAAMPAFSRAMSRA